MNVPRKKLCKRIAYSGNRINCIKKNSLVVDKFRDIFQKRYVVVLMSKWKSAIKKSVNMDIEDIIRDIQELISTDAENNSGKVPHLEKAVEALTRALR